jgi:thiamine pyrophosphokinase
MDFEGYTLVFCNGVPPRRESLERIIRNPRRIVCADGGTQKAIATGYIPDLIVGDLDSLDRSCALPGTTEVVRIASQENTDFEKTLDLMIERGMDNFLIAAFSGGRIDQTLANMQIAYEYSAKCRIALVDDEYVVIPERKIFQDTPPTGTAVSILPMEDETVITTEGLEYELKNLLVHRGGHGISNRTVKRSVRIEVHGGGILVLMKYA